MVQLDAHIIDVDGISISTGSFEHLLNCLDNQKFLPLPDQQTEMVRNEMQAYIDDFNKQCRSLWREAVMPPEVDDETDNDD